MQKCQWSQCHDAKVYTQNRKTVVDDNEHHLFVESHVQPQLSVVSISINPDDVDDEHEEEKHEHVICEMMRPGLQTQIDWDLPSYVSMVGQIIERTTQLVSTCANWLLILSVENIISFWALFSTSKFGITWLLIMCLLSTLSL